MLVSSSKHTNRGFASRVVLPFEQAPHFPGRCPGCGVDNPTQKWTPSRGNSPFSGQAQYFDNHNMLPAIEIPVCDLCLDHMPGRTHEFSSLLAGYFAPLFFSGCDGVFLFRAVARRCRSHGCRCTGVDRVCNPGGLGGQPFHALRSASRQERQSDLLLP